MLVRIEPLKSFIATRSLLSSIGTTTILTRRALQPPDADLLTDYAVTLGMSQGRTLVGAPEAVIQQALSLNPRHVQALALSGSASFEKRDYQGAIATWGQLLSLVPLGDEVRASIEANIRKAEALAAQGRGGASATR